MDCIRLCIYKGILSMRIYGYTVGYRDKGVHMVYVYRCIVCMCMCVYCMHVLCVYSLICVCVGVCVYQCSYMLCVCMCYIDIV